MGVPGLWTELAPVAQTTTLPSYCLTTFTENTNELRGFRLGVDASLWLFHAQQSSGGASPYLRLLFYRMARLLSLPVLPIFVFDGPSRPAWKRGKQVKGRQHAIEQPFTQLIEAFGYQWHRAPGEAEAELAHLNRFGLVDAVLTDDSDALLFGAQVLIRNWGKNLSGTKALSRSASAKEGVLEDVPTSIDVANAAVASRLQLTGSDRDHLITLYRAQDLAAMANLGIDRDGLILIALMSGGDYDATGLMQCGIKIALALARGGFGTTLVEAFKASYSDQASAQCTSADFESFLRCWLEDVRNELRTNERGFLPSRRPKLASSIEDGFLSTQESRRVLAYYVYPLTSEISGIGGALAGNKATEPDLTRLARLSQLYFHWSKDAVLSKFRTILGPGVVTRRLRQEVLEHNNGAQEGPWAALVESPASKTVRRHMSSISTKEQRPSESSQMGSKVSTGQATQEKQRPLHDSPKATRITDFFAKAAIGLSSTTTDSAKAVASVSSEQATASVEILAVKMQRRHAALDPFLDYRVLVAMEEFIRTAESGIDMQVDAELAAARADDDTSDTEAAGLDDDEDRARTGRQGKDASAKRPAPDAPLLMWIPEPLLELSASGAGPLSAFLKELERKADATRRAKGSKKGANANTGSSKAGQMTLNAFVKPLAKSSLSTQVRTQKSFSASAATLQPQAGAPATVRTPRQLRVPSGLQKHALDRRTESVPAPPGSAGRSKPLNRHASLPSANAGGSDTEETGAGVDGDSSIEFLGAFVSSAAGRTPAGSMHTRPTTPPSQPDSDVRPDKSPRKSANAPTRRAPSSRLDRPKNRTLLPSARLLAEPPMLDDSDDDSQHACRAPPFSTALDPNLAAGTKPANKPKARISTITITDSSSDQDVP